MFREIEDIVETLEQAKKRGRKCSVLIGAGCSVSAGIPTAQGFVDIIQERHSRDYERAEIKTYPHCMAKLSRDEQRSLIAEFVDKAKINWGHVALAQLIQAGYVDRVLTTNFDPLIMRACSLIGLYPATYDLAASQHFEPDKVPDQAIFHLHGQRSGFILLNTEKALKDHAEKLEPIFKDAGQGRVWLVVGYSGESDPVFDHLAKVESFDNKLYWIGYKDNDPANHVRENLLKDEKYAFYTKGFDSDSFFVTLAQRLECFPPDFVGKPFSYLDGMFNQLTEYTLPQMDSPVDALKNARSYVQEAIEKIESVKSDVLEVSSNLLSGDYEKVVGSETKLKKGLDTEEISDSLAWAYIAQGNEFLTEARTKRGDEADKLFKQSFEKYAETVRIKPDKHEAFNNWGVALADWAGIKNGDEADELFKQAGEKYAETVRIKPDKHEAFYNWGNALSDWAKTKSGDEASKLFKQAGEKYTEAVRIKPDYHEAFNNWGIALADWAKTKSGDEADELFKQSFEKYTEAVRIKPDKHVAFYNLGIVLADWAGIKSGNEADKLFKQSFEKYAEAVRIKPDYHEAFNKWGNALSDWAKTKSGDEADELFKQAGEKYAETVRIKPDYHEAFNNWGIALSDWAKTKSGNEASELFKQAGEKYTEAVRIKPDYHEAFNNWGVALTIWAKTKSGDEANELFKQASDALLKSETIKRGYASYNLACLYALTGFIDECHKWLLQSKELRFLPSKAHIEKDTDLDSIRNKKWFIDFMKELK